MKTATATATPIEQQPIRVLSDLVAEQGKCVGAGVNAENDPWFPVTQLPGELEAQARLACSGCPVVASCLEMTLRMEQGLRRMEVEGLFGARAPHERIALLRARRGGGAR
ncbi:WhiB family transcriptional regulator [Pilimelia columellifera]|uniref:4Fe-4S Wbl-type domain-containing protein n=1 Tax=Pilimelia columellifera subsp. columellifera TaxID=706583 RepID=A0ABP6B4K7_9ACTN